MADYVGWVNQSGGRGTIGIIHGCLSTIVLCTWNTIHLNVPAKIDSRTTRLLRMLKWMVFATTAPEWVAIHALQEHTESAWLYREGLLLLDVSHSSAEKGICKAHRTFHTPKPQGSTPIIDGPSWTPTHAHFVTMGGFQLVFLDRETYRLNALQFRALLEWDIIALPDIPEETLKDKSKADALTKGLACLQIVWFVVYLISRMVEHLPDTTLEIFTLSVVLCTFFDYFAWWKKPRQVEQAINIPTVHDKDTLEEILNCSEFIDDYLYPGSRVSIADSIGRKRTQSRGLIFVWILPTLAFGTCHLLAWNFQFPTVAEQLLWRISSVGCLVLPLTCLGLGAVSRRTPKHLQSVINIVTVTLWLVYIILRQYLFVEVFAGLRKALPAVYQDVSWSQFVPHIGS